MTATLISPPKLAPGDRVPHSLRSEPHPRSEGVDGVRGRSAVGVEQLAQALDGRRIAGQRIEHHAQNLLGVRRQPPHTRSVPRDQPRFSAALP